MPVTLPNLDDRRFTDLVAEARVLIPTLMPEWTNHNPSDPGITLVELFAYLTETLLYRLNRVTDANVYAFLKLLNGKDWQPSPDKSLDEQVRETVLSLREPYRAVTADDFVRLTFKASDEFQARQSDSHDRLMSGLSSFESAAGDLTADIKSLMEEREVRIHRVLCVPERNLASDDDTTTRYAVSPGQISLVIVTGAGASATEIESLTRFVEDFFEPRRLITTRVHVVTPGDFALGVRLTLVLAPDALNLEEGVVRKAAEDALRTFFDPLTGGHDRKGWPFGRDVYVSELYEVLDKLWGVDYVTRTLEPKTAKPLDEITLSAGDAGRIKRNERGELVSVGLEIDEFVKPSFDLRIVYPEIM